MNRFEKTYSQGSMVRTEIWVDKETGINYLWHRDASSAKVKLLNY